MAKLIACATGTNKSSTNQDYCVTVENLIIGVSGVIVADGIGSHFKSEIAAKFCSNKLKEIIEEITDLNQLSFEKHFNDVKLAFIEFAKNTNEFDFYSIDKSQSLGTTLICILDKGEIYEIAYVGNGSIWHIDGRFNKFGNNFYLPWNSINLLNPHTIEQDGKAALYRYLSVSDTQHLPTILTLSKNQFLPGEILVATTDGVYSNDASPIGKDANNTLWIKAEESLPILYTYLSKFLNNRIIDANNKDLEITLIEFLKELEQKSIMHDDTTIAMIISELAIDFHQLEFDKKAQKELEDEKNTSQ